jgi:hypothetical protein
MKAISLLLMLAAAIALTGCRATSGHLAPAPPPPEDFSQHFELKTGIVFDHHWATVRRLTIRGQGSRTISLGSRQGGLGGADLSPDPQSTYEVLILAMVDPGGRSFTWWATVYKLQDGKRVSGGAGTPRTFPVKRDKKGHVDLYIQEIVQLNDVSGQHAYGEVIQLGHFVTDIPHAPELTLVVK